MKKITVSVSSVLDRNLIESILEQWAMGEGAQVTPRGRLTRRYKGSGNSMHWHIRGIGAEMGTIEVTYLPDLGKLEVSVHDNRLGNWAGMAYLELRKALASRFELGPNVGAGVRFEPLTWLIHPCIGQTLTG